MKPRHSTVAQPTGDAKREEGQQEEDAESNDSFSCSESCSEEEGEDVPMLSTAALPDYYHSLGITPDTSQAAIRDAYRALCVSLRPERNPRVNITT